MTCATACLQAVLGEVQEKHCWQAGSGTHKLTFIAILSEALR